LHIFVDSIAEKREHYNQARGILAFFSRTQFMIVSAPGRNRERGLGFVARFVAALLTITLGWLIIPNGNLAVGQGLSPNLNSVSPGNGPLDSSQPNLQRMLNSGEYSLALQQVSSAATADRNELLSQVAAHQASNGATAAALDTLRSSGSNRLTSIDSSMIQMLHNSAYTSNNPQYGTGSHRATSQQQQGSNSGTPGTFGAQGGGVQADFSSLINLIQTTVSPLDWEDNGGVGAITPFPNGVLIDVKGVLSFAPKPGERLGSRLQPPPTAINLTASSDLRLISLPKLEAQLLRLSLTGQPIPESIKLLGGMYDIRYIAIEPESGDLILAGPAGPWEINQEGIAINQETGKAVLHLDDLVVCLRNAFRGPGVLGCSIDPRPGQFKDAAEKANKLNLTSPKIRDRFITVVGPQDAVVFGVPSSSHAAQVLLTSDYHLKLLAMGNINAGPNLPSYLDRCSADDMPQEIVRWWFTLGQPTIDQSDDGSVFRLNGPAMQLKTESQMFAKNGAKAAGKPVSVAASRFVSDFNRELESVSKSFPLYGQLENLFKLSIVAQIIHSNQLHQKISWQPEFIIGRRTGSWVYGIQRYPEITEVDLVVNHRTVKFRKDGKIFNQTIVAISGGVNSNTSAKQISRLTRQVKRTELSTDIWRGLNRSKNAAEKEKHVWFVD